MPYKTCPTCQQFSYSACVSSIWLCPFCGKELTLCKAVYNHRCLPTLIENPSLRGNIYILKRY